MGYEAKPVFFYEPSNSTPQIKEVMESFLKSWLSRHSSTDELKLYHYTTLEGLKGILNSRSIWLTHASTLNDPLELKYGEELILNLIDKSNSMENDENIKHLLKHLSDFVKSFNTVTYQSYVACFCESENLLSQWRAYGDRGGGFNLGFRFRSNTKFYHTTDDTEKDSHVILRKMIYDVDDQSKLISDYISSIIKGSSNALKQFRENGEIPIAWPAIAATECVNILLDLMLSFKNPVFKEENEWRLIKGRLTNFKPEQLKFRETKDGLIPYIEAYMVAEENGKSLFPLSSIKFGPILDYESTLSSLQLFLSKESVSSGKIIINAGDVCINGAGYVLRK
jgi:hypothetical protein